MHKYLGIETTMESIKVNFKYFVFVKLIYRKLNYNKATKCFFYIFLVLETVFFE
jgi:hypothetical protein